MLYDRNETDWERNSGRGRIDLTMQHEDFERGIMGSRGGHRVFLLSKKPVWLDERLEDGRKTIV